MTERIREFLRSRREDGPCLVVDLEVVRENYLSFARALPDTRVFYAVKANPSPEVLKLLAQGLTLAQIAEQLGVAVKTVANHQSAIKQKLGADTGRELVRQAMRLGIIPNV